MCMFGYLCLCLFNFARARNPGLAAKQNSMTENEDKDRLKVDELHSGRRRKSSNASTIGKSGRPKSMVTYDKGPPRDLGFDKTIDNRELGLGHDE